MLAMEWETVWRAGTVAVVDQLTDGLMIRATRKFLRETVEQFAALSAKYCDTVGEMPFTYRERQVHLTLLPAITRASDAVLAEHPIRRSLPKEDCRASVHGWVDYWASAAPLSCWWNLSTCSEAPRLEGPRLGSAAHGKRRSARSAP